jgi:uncharacterized damage-inducible protein DinB
MSTSLMSDAFGHHVWATRRLLDACLVLDPIQLETPVAGTYGSILQTARHLVGADGWYLFLMNGRRDLLVDEDRSGLAELDAAMARDGEAWSTLLAADVDPGAMVIEVEDNGYRREASIGARLAQALHHGTDHRSQICTALTALGVQPPSIDVWDYGNETGLIVETLPPT